MHRAKSANDFYANTTMWREELAALRKILVASGLEEEIKWGTPCYTLEGVNVVGVGSFKSYFGLWFYQGALLNDASKVLVNAQDGGAKAQRQWRMNSASDIKPVLIARYVKEAAANAKAGKKVVRSPPKILVIPAELAAALAADKKASAAFDAMTPSCRREYANYVGEAKQAATKERRIEKIMPMIRAGGGLNDKYRNC